nr:hypothetical protein [Halococcus hamelinensis]
MKFWRGNSRQDGLIAALNTGGLFKMHRHRIRAAGDIGICGSGENNGKDHAAVLSAYPGGSGMTQSGRVDLTLGNSAITIFYPVGVSGREKG